MFRPWTRCRSASPPSINPSQLRALACTGARIAVQNRRALSTGLLVTHVQDFPRERARGIEPPFSAWEADVLPLNYARATDCGSVAGRISRPHQRSRCQANPHFPGGAQNVHAWRRSPRKSPSVAASCAPRGTRPSRPGGLIRPRRQVWTSDAITCRDMTSRSPQKAQLGTSTWIRAAQTRAADPGPARTGTPTQTAGPHDPPTTSWPCSRHARRDFGAGARPPVHFPPLMLAAGGWRTVIGHTQTSVLGALSHSSTCQQVALRVMVKYLEWEPATYSRRAVPRSAARSAPLVAPFGAPSVFSGVG